MKTGTDVVRCSIYCRVSSESQATEDKVSMEQQELACRECAQAKAWEVFGVYADPGVSGRKWKEREGMQRLVADAQAGEFQVVLCYDQDRLARANEGFSNLAAVLKAQGIRVVTPFGVLDLSQPEDELLYTIKGGVSTYNSQQLARRTREAREEYAKKGRWGQGVKLFGYSWNRELKRPTVDAREAAVVLEAFRLAANEKLSCEKIAHELNDRGLHARGRLVKKRRGEVLPREEWTDTRGLGEWYAAQIAALLRERRYKGEGWETVAGIPVREDLGPCRILRDADGKPRRDRQDRLEVEPAPALVDSDTWERAQVVAGHHRRTRRPWAGRKALLSGMVWCGRCGGRMTIRRPKGYTYFGCNKAVRTRKGTCDMRHVQAKVVEQTVWEEVARMASHPELVEEAAAHTRSKHLAEWQAELRKVEQRIAALRMREARARRGYEEGKYDLADLAASKQEIEEAWDREAQRQAELEALIEGEAVRARGVDATQAALRRAGNLEGAIVEEKRKLLTDLRARVLVFGPDSFRLEWAGAAVTESLARVKAES